MSSRSLRLRYHEKITDPATQPTTPPMHKPMTAFLALAFLRSLACFCSSVSWQPVRIANIKTDIKNIWRRITSTTCTPYARLNLCKTRGAFSAVLVLPVFLSYCPLLVRGSILFHVSILFWRKTLPAFDAKPYWSAMQIAWTLVPPRLPDN